MDNMPVITVSEDGSKLWSHSFSTFDAKVYLPVCDAITEIVNFGFCAPYLLVFEEKKQSLEEAKQYADRTGLAQIAAESGGSVVFIWPNNDGGWKRASENLFSEIISESRISQYYQDGTATIRNRFTGEWGQHYIRGAVLRTCLYGRGEAADYIAKNCLKTIEGDGLYGKGDVTPVTCVLEHLSVVPKPERRDIPVVSVGNTEQINQALKVSLDDVRGVKQMNWPEDYPQFIGTFRRMMGNLEKEADLKEMGMRKEPGYCVVTTSNDNRGDDRETKEHKIGYVAYYNEKIIEEMKSVPLVLCFHGGGDSAMCMTSVSGWFRIAAKYNFLLVSIENHLNSTATETMELIEHLKGIYPVDVERIYSTGFSMGGCKSWDMYQEYPKVFAGVAPMDATFEVGCNSYGDPVESYNHETVVPVFYAGGEKTPLPELPFQAQKCTDRMKYVLEVNQAVAEYKVEYNQQENWSDPIWGISGDVIYKLPNVEREGSVLTLNLFESQNGCCYSIFGCINDQQHEVRHHTCEQAWLFLSQFRRLANGEIIGGNMEAIKKLYER